VAARSNATEPRITSNSLEQECEQYRHELRSFFIRRSFRRDAVDDLVQLVYLRLLHSPSSETVRDPRAFMYRVAWNVLHDENQRVQRESQQISSCAPEQLAQMAEEVGVLWADDSDEALVRDEFERALEGLPRVCQVAFLRQYRDGHSYAEIAEELGVTTHAIKKYMVKALHHLHTHFGASDVDSE
jgi:RNA polymerase sigma-70 factor (ECF subfamily)